MQISGRRLCQMTSRARARKWKEQFILSSKLLKKWFLRYDFSLYLMVASNKLYIKHCTLTHFKTEVQFVTGNS